MQAVVAYTVHIRWAGVLEVHSREHLSIAVPHLGDAISISEKLITHKLQTQRGSPAEPETSLSTMDIYQIDAYAE